MAFMRFIILTWGRSLQVQDLRPEQTLRTCRLWDGQRRPEEAGRSRPWQGGIAACRDGGLSAPHVENRGFSTSPRGYFQTEEGRAYQVSVPFACSVVLPRR